MEKIIKHRLKIKNIMKQTILLLVGIFFMFSALGQKPTMKEKKKVYNYKTYSWQQGDRYNPTMAGVLSVLVPGLGQITSGETGRGLAFLVPDVIAEVVFYNAYKKSEEFEGEQNDAQTISGIVIIGLSIWSVIDAAQVAKVNNMYFRDMSKNNVSLKIEPSMYILNNNFSYGLSLQISF